MNGTILLYNVVILNKYKANNKKIKIIRYCRLLFHCVEIISHILLFIPIWICTTKTSSSILYSTTGHRPSRFCFWFHKCRICRTDSTPSGHGPDAGTQVLSYIYIYIIYIDIYIKELMHPVLSYPEESMSRTGKKIIANDDFIVVEGYRRLFHACRNTHHHGL